MHWHCRHYAYARLGFWCKLSFSSVNHWNAYTSLIKVFTDILIFLKEYVKIIVLIILVL